MRFSRLENEFIRTYTQRVREREKFLLYFNICKWDGVRRIHTIIIRKMSSFEPYLGDMKHCHRMYVFVSYLYLCLRVRMCVVEWYVCVTKYCFDMNRIRCASLLRMLSFRIFWFGKKARKKRGSNCRLTTKNIHIHIHIMLNQFLKQQIRW